MNSKFLSSSIALGTFLLIGTPAAMAQDATAAVACAAKDDKAEYLCGTHNVEKLIPIHGTRWAIASSIAGGPVKTPPMYFINLDKRTFVPLDPKKVKVAADPKRFPDCEKPDFSIMNSAGMDSRKVNGQNVFYALNHGGRMAAEVFKVDVREDAVPQLTWQGCVKPPESNWFMDDVAIFKDGSMIVTSFFDTTDANFQDTMGSATPTGKMGRWQAGKGWTLIPTGPVSGPNGVILSTDEKKVFFADWGGKGLVRMDLATQAMDRVNLGYLVDNILWDSNRKYILAGGQNGTVQEVFGGCAASKTKVNCDTPFSLVAVNPDTLEAKPIFGPGNLGPVGVGTGAMQDGDHLWLTSFRADRLPRIPYPFK